MIDSPFVLMALGVFVGGAVAGFLSQRKRQKPLLPTKPFVPIGLASVSDNDLFATLSALHSTAQADEVYQRRIILVIQEEIARREELEW